MSKLDKIISGFAWFFSFNVFQAVVNLLVSVVLARLMLPSEFGLVAEVTIFSAVGEVLLNGGMTNSLIRTENPDRADYSTVFFINLAVSLFLYGLLFFSAPFIAGFFHQPILTPVVRVYMLCLLAFAFSAVQSTRLVRAMRFKLLTMIHLPSLIASGIVGIVLAYMGWGVWSLVYMYLTRHFLFALQLWIRSGWTPTWTIDRVKLKHHFSFGYKLLLSTVLDRVYQNIYAVVIGRVFLPLQVGYYSRAYTLVQVPVQGVSDPLAAVTYPALSTMQNDNARLQASYRKLIQQTLFVIVPVLTMLIVTAEPLFRVLMTDKWLPAVPYFRILCVAGMLNTVNGYNLNILLVKGRSDLYLRLSVIEKALITVGVLSSFSFGIYTLLYFQLASSIVMFLINSSVGGRLIDYSGQRQVGDVYNIFLVALLSGAAAWVLNVYLSGQLIGRWEDMARIGLVGGCFALLFLAICRALKVQAAVDMKELIIKRLLIKHV